MNPYHISVVHLICICEEHKLSFIYQFFLFMRIPFESKHKTANNKYQEIWDGSGFKTTQRWWMGLGSRLHNVNMAAL